MSLENFGKYHAIGKPDQTEMGKNREHTMAIKLLKKIVEDFYRDDFSLQDVIDSYNDQAGKKGYGTRYGKSHLDHLVEKELLEYNEDKKTYSVDHNSPHLAKMEMGDEMKDAADEKINWQEMESKTNGLD